MKKTYVKPVMESEEFVANEYVAACWRFTCKGGGTGSYKTDDENYQPTVSIRDDDPFYKEEIFGLWGYKGEISGCEENILCTLGSILGSHSLVGAPVKSENPNASV